MRKICYSVAMSLDGYIAGLNGEADWIVMDPEIDFGELFSRFDTILMGRKTFEATQAMGEAGEMPGIKSVIVSKTLRQEDYPNVTIIGDDLKNAISRIRSEPGKDIWLFGGGLLFRSLLDLGLVDQVEVGIIPVVLGNGITFLPERSQRTKLRLINSKIYKTSGIVGLEYEVER